MVAFGGIDSLLGPIVGAATFTLLDEWLVSFDDLRLITYGAVMFVLFLGLRRRGIPTVQGFPGVRGLRSTAHTVSDWTGECPPRRYPGPQVRASVSHGVGATIVFEALSAWEVAGPFLGELSLQDSSGLPDLDEVAVGVAHVAAQFGATIDRLDEKGRTAGAPQLVAGFDVCDAQVEERGHVVRRLVRNHICLGLVRGATAARVHDHPAVGQLDDARVLCQDHVAAENVGVERTRATSRTMMKWVTKIPSMGAGRFATSMLEACSLIVSLSSFSIVAEVRSGSSPTPSRDASATLRG